MDATDKAGEGRQGSLPGRAFEGSRLPPAIKPNRLQKTGPCQVEPSSEREFWLWGTEIPILNEAQTLMELHGCRHTWRGRRRPRQGVFKGRLEMRSALFY